MLGRIVVDIPIEDQAAEKAQEISLFYDANGWVSRRDYTWVLYARSEMSYSQLEGFRNRIIRAAQEWKRVHGLDEHLFSLIAELARAGVIWRPTPPTGGLKVETLWLWKKMGFADILTDALETARVAFKLESEAVKNRLAALDRIVELPKLIVMGTAEGALKKAREVIGRYLEERNRTVELIYSQYPQMTIKAKTVADTVMDKIRTDDDTLRKGLGRIDMDLADFGQVMPALTLGVIPTAQIILTLVIVIVIAYGLSIWHARTRATLGKEQIASLKSVRDETYRAIEAERVSRIAALPILPAEERRKKLAEIDSWAAAEKARVAKEYAIQLTTVETLAEPTKKRWKIPWWAWAGGGAVGLGLVIYKSVQLVKAPPVPEVPVKKPRIPRKAPPGPLVKALPYIVGGVAVVGVLIIGRLLFVAPPPVPAPRLPAPPAAS